MVLGVNNLKMDGFSENFSFCPIWAKGAKYGTERGLLYVCHSIILKVVENARLYYYLFSNSKNIFGKILILGLLTTNLLSNQIAGFF